MEFQMISLSPSCPPMPLSAGFSPEQHEKSSLAEAEEEIQVRFEKSSLAEAEEEILAEAEEEIQVRFEKSSLAEAEEEIQIIVEMFITYSSTLCISLLVKPSCTIKSLNYKITSQLSIYQEPNSNPYYNVLSKAFYLGPQLLPDDSTLAQCNVSNMERLSVLPCSPFLITAAHTTAPERWPIIHSIRVNSLESVGSLKNKIFAWTHIPSHKQLLCCGGKWLLDDERRLFDVGIAQQIGNGENFLDMPLLHVIPYRRITLNNEKFDISVKVPHCKLQFCLTVHPTDSINHVKSMILQKSHIYDETHMLIFDDKNLLEDGCSVLLDHVIEEKDQLTLCQKGSFLIWVSRKGSDQKFTLEVESLDTVDVLKKKIEKMTGIASENQILFYERDIGRVVMYKGCLVRYGIVKLSNPKVPEHLISYTDDDERTKLYLSRKYRNEEVYVPRIPLSFWEKVSNSACARVPVDDFLMQVNPRSDTETSFKVHILIHLRVDLTFCMMLTVGRGDTVETLKTKIKEKANVHTEIDDLTYIQEGNYVLLINKQQLQEDVLSTIEHCGITDACQILLCPKDSFSIIACFPSRCLVINNDEKISAENSFIGQSVVVNCLDTVAIMKEKISTDSGFPVKFMELSFNGVTLSDEKLLVECGIVSHPVSSVDRRWRRCTITLKVLQSKICSAI